jgi:hypothetical protein
LWESDRLTAAEAADEDDVTGQEVLLAKLPPQERAEGSPVQRPPRGPDRIEVAHAIFAYARRIGHRRLHFDDIVIEAGSGWMGFVYSPKVTWEQRLQVYQHALHVLAVPDGEPSAAVASVSDPDAKG